MYPPSWGDLQAAHAASLFAGLLDFSLHGSKERQYEKFLLLQRSVSSVGHSKGRLASAYHPFIHYWTKPRVLTCKVPCRKGLQQTEVKNFILFQKLLWYLQSSARRPQISCHGVVKRGNRIMQEMVQGLENLLAESHNHHLPQTIHIFNKICSFVFLYWDI